MNVALTFFISNEIISPRLLSQHFLFVSSEQIKLIVSIKVSHLSDELEHFRFSTVLRIYFAVAHHSPSLPSFYFLYKDDC